MNRLGMSHQFHSRRSYLTDPHSDWNDPWPLPTAYERRRARIRRRILLSISLSTGLLVIAGRLLLWWLQ